MGQWCICLNPWHLSCSRSTMFSLVRSSCEPWMIGKNALKGLVNHPLFVGESWWIMVNLWISCPDSSILFDIDLVGESWLMFPNAGSCGYGSILGPNIHIFHRQLVARTIKWKNAVKLCSEASPVPIPVTMSWLFHCELETSHLSNDTGDTIHDPR